MARGRKKGRVENGEKCSIEYMGYLFDFTPLIGVLEDRRGRGCARALLEAPQGMVQFLPRLAKRLEECIAARDTCVEPVIRLDPSYGSCDIGFDYAERTGASIVVHIGHLPYLYRYWCSNNYCSQWGYAVSTRKTLVMIPAEYVKALEWADELAEIVASKAAGGRVALGYTAQHKALAKTITLLLRRRGVEVARLEPVMGCHYSRLVSRDPAHLYIVLAAGMFHGLGLGLYLYTVHGNPLPGIGVLNPYDKTYRDIRGDVEKTLRKRYWLVSQALEATSFAVIAGAKPGQYRPWIHVFLKKLGEKRGKRVDILVSSNLSREYLDNLSPREYDAYITASCPRLAIEDYSNYWKPVLTPGEARMVFTKNLNQYLFPW